MRLTETIDGKNGALRVRDVAQLLDVSRQQVYKLAARGEIPSFRVANSVRFDPHDIAIWLREKYPPSVANTSFKMARSA
jgi:excisionase family DNA binding protein